MFRYVRQATVKKPLHELDHQPFYSPAHPQGDDLKALLELGEKYSETRSNKTSQAHLAPQLRSQFGCVYQWVFEHKLDGVKGAKRLQADAVCELHAGRPKLVEFVKRHKTSLDGQLAF